MGPVGAYRYDRRFCEPAVDSAFGSDFLGGVSQGLQDLHACA